MILCHKCAGVLQHTKAEDVTGLLGCQCMSGYVRGFEPIVDRSTALDKQINQQIEWAELYTRQGRSQQQIDERLDKAIKLEALK